MFDETAFVNYDQKIKESNASYWKTALRNMSFGLHNMGPFDGGGVAFNGERYQGINGLPDAIYGTATFEEDRKKIAEQDALNGQAFRDEQKKLKELQKAEPDRVIMAVQNKTVAQNYNKSVSQNIIANRSFSSGTGSVSRSLLGV